MLDAYPKYLVRSLDFVPASLVESESTILATLIVIPLLLLGADYLLDDAIGAGDELRKKPHFRSLIFLGLTLHVLVVIGASVGADAYQELLGQIVRNLFFSMVILIVAFATAKVLLKKRFEWVRKAEIERIELELPQYLEMFHILISSGMSVLSAMKNLSQGKSKSPTRSIIARVIASVESGRSVERAMDDAIIPVGSDQLRRFSDAVIVGMERGSSMGQSLRSLIAESRNQSKILLLRRAGKAEIALLIPVVFLILPISILFALWPSYSNLVSILG